MNIKNLISPNIPNRIKKIAHISRNASIRKYKVALSNAEVTIIIRIY